MIILYTCNAGDLYIIEWQGMWTKKWNVMFLATYQAKMHNRTRDERPYSSGERRFVECVANACLVTPYVAVEQLVTCAIITFLGPPLVHASLSLPFVLAPRPFPLLCSRPFPSLGRTSSRDLVAVHRSVENESTSCRSPPGDSYLRALPRDRYFLRILYVPFF